MSTATTSDFCSSILKLSNGIRFVGIASNKGTLISHAYRKGLKPLLTKKESELSFLQSYIRLGTRQVLEHKLGKTIYGFAMYEKVKRATIPLRRPASPPYMLMLSFDTDVDHETIILTKIIPLLDELVL